MCIMLHIEAKQNLTTTPVIITGEQSVETNKRQHSGKLMKLTALQIEHI
jgi:hypothetical protein